MSSLKSVVEKIYDKKRVFILHKFYFEKGSSSEDEAVIKTQKRRQINNMLYQQVC